MSQTSSLNDKAIKLFYQFARMEYALKATGYHFGDGDAKPNWTKFAKSNEIEELIANPSSQELADAIKYVRDNPPRKQIVENGKLEWSESAPTTNSDADLLLLYVRRVRNNLFHGGKFNGHWFAPERSEQLIDCARIILENCRISSTDIDEAYSNELAV